MHASVLGQMNWLGMKVQEHNSVNVELQRKEMVSGFIECDDTEYNGILDAHRSRNLYPCTAGKKLFAPDGQRQVPDE